MGVYLYDWSCEELKSIFDKAEETQIGAFTEVKTPHGRLIDADAVTLDKATLMDYFINSVDENDEPVWTERHINEILKDFDVVPKTELQTHMTEDDAFYIVYKDLTKDEGVLTGRYDAKNGSEKYMHGVCSVMEYIAYKVGEDCYDAFTDRFTKNMIESKEKAERSKK